MELSMLNIYPMNKENLKAMLDYYLPGFYSGEFESLYKNITNTPLTLIELETYLGKILQHIAVLFEQTHIDQSNILSYAIEVFYMIKWDGIGKNNERLNVIKMLRSQIGIPELFDNDYTPYDDDFYPDQEFDPGEDNIYNYPEMFGGDNYNPDLDLNEQSQEYWDSRF